MEYANIKKILLLYHKWCDENVNYWDSSPNEKHVNKFIKEFKTNDILTKNAVSSPGK